MKNFLFLLFLITGVSCMHKINITPPSPAKKSTTLEKHGDKRQDDYFWLKERENPEVVKYLESENKYTEEIFSEHKKLEINYSRN